MTHGGQTLWGKALSISLGPLKWTWWCWYLRSGWCCKLNCFVLGNVTDAHRQGLSFFFDTHVTATRHFYTWAEMCNVSLQECISANISVWEMSYCPTYIPGVKTRAWSPWPVWPRVGGTAVAFGCLSWMPILEHSKPAKLETVIRKQTSVFCFIEKHPIVQPKLTPKSPQFLCLSHPEFCLKSFCHPLVLSTH